MAQAGAQLRSADDLLDALQVQEHTHIYIYIYIYLRFMESQLLGTNIGDAAAPPTSCWTRCRCETHWDPVFVQLLCGT